MKAELKTVSDGVNDYQRLEVSFPFEDVVNLSLGLRSPLSGETAIRFSNVHDFLVGIANKESEKVYGLTPRSVVIFFNPNDEFVVVFQPEEQSDGETVVS